MSKFKVDPQSLLNSIPDIVSNLFFSNCISKVLDPKRFPFIFFQICALSYCCIQSIYKMFCNRLLTGDLLFFVNATI